MRKIERLRKEALESCEWRGHQMRKFERAQKWLRGSQNGLSMCQTCGAWVVINANPAANDIDIGGPAVALICPAESI